MRTVPVEELPLELPATKNFQPHDSGESPLANCEDWLEVEIDGQKGRREIKYNASMGWIMLVLYSLY